LSCWTIVLSFAIREQFLSEAFRLCSGNFHDGLECLRPELPVDLQLPPQSVRGFASRYGKLTGDKKDQIINFGGTGSNLASVFIVKWDGREVTGILPKNAPGGLQKTILENQLMKDSKGNDFLAHVTYFSQFFGLKVRDERFVSRLCNINMNDLATDETARQKLFEDLIRAKNRIYHVTQGHVVMYMSPDVFTMLEIAAFQKTNTIVGYKDGLTADTRLLTFSGIPIRRNDFQSEPETQVV
jgi:hypothetical protein